MNKGVMMSLLLNQVSKKLKALTEQYEKLKKEVLGKNPFRALADAVFVSG